MPKQVLRHPDWRARLQRYLAASHRYALRPGKHDCALEAAAAVKAMTGRDFARGFRGYRSYPEGLRKLKAKGFSDHVALAAAHFPSIPVAMARVGDLAVLPGEGMPALGIVIGERISVFGPDGRGTVPLLSAVTAFRVGP